MANALTDEQKPKLIKPSALPPMFGPIEGGKQKWIRVAKVDFNLMGYLLSCHLLLEHYMDKFLKAHYGQLDWAAAKLTFRQRIGLLTT